MDEKDFKIAVLNDIIGRNAKAFADREVALTVQIQLLTQQVEELKNPAPTEPVEN